MTNEERKKAIDTLRKSTRHKEPNQDFLSDQKLKLPQPQRFKKAEAADVIDLPSNYDALTLDSDFTNILLNRTSSRFYSEGSISLLQFSFLCWATIGVKPGTTPEHPKRTFPSAGARYPFELYAAVLRVEGLAPGYYHYLPQTHQLELLKEIDAEDASLAATLTQTVCGQGWVAKASVLFYYSMVPGRSEWCYGSSAHRVMLMDAGYAMENLYLACSAMQLGSCSLAAINNEVADPLFGLDGDNEYLVACQAAGTISTADAQNEINLSEFLRSGKLFER